MEHSVLVVSLNSPWESNAGFEHIIIFCPKKQTVFLLNISEYGHAQGVDPASLCCLMAHGLGFSPTQPRTKWSRYCEWMDTWRSEHLVTLVRDTWNLQGSNVSTEALSRTQIKPLRKSKNTTWKAWLCCVTHWGVHLSLFALR